MVRFASCDRAENLSGSAPACFPPTLDWRAQELARGCPTPSGRTVIIALSSDPDVRIQEDFAGTMHKKVAVEIKGGADLSNVHNRAGEAEKSHQKAKADGFRDFWTIIAKRGISLSKLQEESPTTTSWFDLNEVLLRHGDDWEEFKRRIVGEAGIPT